MSNKKRNTKVYEADEWDFSMEPHGYHDPDLNTYTDLDGNPITGILRDFYYFEENDPRNDVYVENGKRMQK